MLTAPTIVAQLDLASLPATAAKLASMPEHRAAVAANPTTCPQLLLKIAAADKKAAVHSSIVSRPLSGELRERYLSTEKRAGVLNTLERYNPLTDAEVDQLLDRQVLTAKLLERLISSNGWQPRFLDTIEAHGGKLRLRAAARYQPADLDDSRRAQLLSGASDWLTKPYARMGVDVKAAIEVGPRTLAAAVAPGQHSAVVASAAAHRDLTLAQQLDAAGLTDDGAFTEAADATLERYRDGKATDRYRPNRTEAIVDQLLASWTSLLHSPWTYPDVLVAIERALRVSRNIADDERAEFERIGKLDEAQDALGRRRHYRGIERTIPDPHRWDADQARRVVYRAKSWRRFTEIPMVLRYPGLTELDARELLHAIDESFLRPYWPTLQDAFDEVVERHPRLRTEVVALFATDDPDQPFDDERYERPETLLQHNSGRLPEVTTRPLAQLEAPGYIAGVVVSWQRELGDQPDVWQVLLGMVDSLGTLTPHEAAQTALDLAS